MSTDLSNSKWLHRKGLELAVVRRLKHQGTICFILSYVCSLDRDSTKYSDNPCSPYR